MENLLGDAVTQGAWAFEESLLGFGLNRTQENVGKKGFVLFGLKECWLQYLFHYALSCCVALDVGSFLFWYVVLSMTEVREGHSLL